MNKFVQIILLKLIPCVTLLFLINYLKLNVNNQSQVSKSYSGSSAVTETEKDVCFQKSSRTAVVILTYMRCGSTLMGEILKNIDGAFYIYEPFLLIQRFLEAVYSPTYGNVVLSEEFRQISLDWAEKLLNCNLEETVFNSEYLKLTNASIKADLKNMFNASSFSSPIIDDYLKNPENIEEDQQRCRQSSVLILKTIRISNLEWFWQTFEDRNAKIIHLLRDPRAVQHSKIKVMKSYSSSIPTICIYGSRNLKYMVNLAERNEHSLHKSYYEMSYEQFATNPAEESKKLLDGYLGFPFLEHTEIFIKKLTSTASNVTSKFSVTPRNITLVANKWRTAMDKEMIKEIESNEDCRSVMNHVGYQWPYSKD